MTDNVFVLNERQKHNLGEILLITQKANQYTERESSSLFDNKALLLLSSIEVHLTFFKQAFSNEILPLQKIVPSSFKYGKCLNHSFQLK